MAPKKEHRWIPTYTDAFPETEQSVFPQFKDGDVKIVITSARTYQLHSRILAAGSEMFEDLLSEENAADLSSKAIKKGVVVRFRFVAGQNYTTTIGCPLVLNSTKLDSNGRPEHGENLTHVNENGMPIHPLHMAYHLVLGAFYHKPIELARFSQTTLDDILEMAHHVLEVAEYLQCVDMLTKPIEAAVLGEGQTYQRAVANKPAAWLYFADRIKSKQIFKEALIHAIGKYNTPDMQEALLGMKQEIRDEVVPRARKLMQNVKAALKKIVSYYPRSIQRSRNANHAEMDKFHRGSYANDIFSWMALTVFRHYVSQNAVTEHGVHAEDMGFELISAINEGGNAYLNDDFLEYFEELFPLSSKGEQVVQDRIGDLKDDVQQFTFGLMRNRTELNTAAYTHKYFTSGLDFWEEPDYPWEPKKVVPVESEDENEDEEDIEQAMDMDRHVNGQLALGY